MAAQTHTGASRPWPVIALILLIGLAASAYTLHACVQLATRLAHATYTAGIIADPQPHPVIRFLDGSGRAVTFVQNGFIVRAAGAPVPVLYDERDPAGTAQAATFWTTWGTALWMLPVGAAFTLSALYEGIEKWYQR